MSCAELNPYPAAAHYRRDPQDVMRLARMGAFHPSRLSFLQCVLRRAEREQWHFERSGWHINDVGVGYALYTLHSPEHSYTLVCFAHDLPPEQRSDRVIATAWDATFALFDGLPDHADIERLQRNVPHQEAGRVSVRELTLSRANRSVRLFEHVVERLAAGQQPDLELLDSTGYLMRTTAVYGSGKFGAADRFRISSRAELRGPFRAEMLTVWLIRVFTVDLVEHLARIRGGEHTAQLSPELRRRLGVGNSTGLGMAPFLMNHPVLLNNWMMAREEALARVRAIPDSSAATRTAFRKALSDARENAQRWSTIHPVQLRKLDALRTDLSQLSEHIQLAPAQSGDVASGDAQSGDQAAHDPLMSEQPWNSLWQWAENALTLEGQEALVSLLLEPHGPVVDTLADCMDADEEAAFRIDGKMAASELLDGISQRYDWALNIEYTVPEHSARFWYVSEEKLEPRLGQRFEEPGATLEQPLAIGRDVAALAADLQRWTGAPTVAAFLSIHSEHRHTVRRVQIGLRCPFAEIRDNLISATLLPIDLLRCKLSFFGASRFDPRSDRWVRISLFQGAPHPDELLASAQS